MNYQLLERFAQQFETLVLDAVKDKCPTNLPAGIDAFLSRGRQGEVYTIQSNDKVLKIQIGDVDSVPGIIQNLTFLKDKSPDIYPKVFDFGTLCEIDNENISVGRKTGIAYYYVMEKLLKTPKASDVSKIIQLKSRNKPLGISLSLVEHFM
jgi:hypothetical protein